MKYLKKVDSQIFNLIKKEEQRQAQTLMMIPSENIASHAVNEAVGSVLGNKYAEGYWGKRYYQGNAVIDEVEELVVERAKKLYDVPFANVQPHSGSPANFAVYNALLNQGDVLMGLTLTSGGHLTHGAKFTASSKYFKSVQYEVGKDGFLDYKELEKQVREVKPKILVAGVTAYPRLINWKKFAQIAEDVGSYLMADISHLSGLIVAGVYPSPVQYVHIVTTTTHKTLRGPRGAMILVTAKGLKKDPELGDKINKSIIPGIQGGPHMNSIAGIGVALKEATKPSFKKYAEQILRNATVLADELSKYKFELVSGGTDSHLLLIDIRNKDLLGNTLAEGCDAAGIVFNRNSVPYDPNPPFYPSGIRLGTPGITSRGMKEREMKKIAKFIHMVVEGLQQTKLKMKVSIEQEKKRSVRAEMIAKTPIIKKINLEVKKLCKQFPIKKTY